MQVGIPHSILTPMGEIVFNDLSGDATSKSLAGQGGVWPYGLPDGNGYLMQWIGGMHGAPTRNPVNDRPHKHGGIVHKFWSSAKYFTLTGLVIGSTPENKQLLDDYLTNYIHSTMQQDARYFFHPPGQDVRFLTVRNYETADIQGPMASPGSSPSDIAAPKQYVTQFVAANPFAYRYTEDDETIAFGGSVFVPNIGLAETWPIMRVHGPISAFTLANLNSGFQLEWFSNTEISVGHFIEVNMYNETMYQDGDQNNELAGMLDAPSDFWAVAAGGAPVQFVGTSSGTGGSATCDVLSNAAWV